MIRLKKTFAFFTVIIAALAGLLFSAYSGLKDKSIAEFNAQQSLLARESAHSIEKYVLHYQQDMEMLARIRSILVMDETGKELIHACYASHASEIQAITRVDENGRILYTFPENESVIGSDISGQAHIRQILKTHAPVVSEVITAVQGFRTVACHVPVFDGPAFKGTLAVLFSFGRLSDEFIKIINTGRDGHAWVISRKGVILYSQVPDQTGKTVFEIYRNDPGVIAIAREMMAGKHGEARYRVYQSGPGGIRKIANQAVYYPIRLGDTFWSIIVASPEKQILAPLRGFRNQLLVIVLLFITVMVAYLISIIRARTILNEEKKRRETETALLESEKKYRTILDDIEDGYFEVDVRGNLTFFNNALSHIIGYSPSELMGKNNREFMTPETAEKVYETFNHVYASEMPSKGFDWEVVQKNGATRPIDTSVSLIKDASGQKTGFRGIARDISERKQAEEKMREYKNRYQALFDRSLDCVFIHDFRGKFIDANDTAVKLLGYARNDIPNLSMKDILTREQYPLAALVIKELQENGFQKKLTGFKLKHKNGQTVDVETTSAVIYKDGKPFAIQGIARDITEKLKMEAQFHQARKIEAIGTLAGGIAHDFNNILTAIIGYTEMAQYALPENSPAAAHINKVYHAGIRASNLVKQILAFSRQTEYDLKIIKIQEIVKEAITFLRASIPTTIDIRQHIQADCDPIKADPTQIHQIMMNLCTNAYYAMRETGGILDISLTRTGGFVVLSVSDTGVGIEKDILGEIFDPYFTTKPKGEGTGMGLSLVHGIVKTCGGEITVESETGKGAVFRIYFPAMTGDALSKGQHADKSCPAPGGHERILLADDEKGVVDINRQILESLGYQVSAFTESESALEAFLAKPHEYDLVLTDMTMPRLNGLQLAEKIHAARPGLPIILCTGFSDLITEEKLRASGIRKMIMKPVFRNDLAATVRMALDTPD